MSSDPIEQALTGLRHDLGALRGELAQRFDTADRQFTYLDRRFDDATHRLGGVEQRGALALDDLAGHVDTAVRRSARHHLAALLGTQAVQLLVVALLVVPS